MVVRSQTARNKRSGGVVKRRGTRVSNRGHPGVDEGSVDEEDCGFHTDYCRGGRLDVGTRHRTAMAGAAPTAQPPAGQQPPAEPGAGQGRGGRGGGRGGPIVPPVAFEDRTGFESMFDGKSLTPGATARAEARKAAAAKQAEEAKAAAAAGQPAPTGRGRGGFGGGPQPSLFQDWDGDPKFWRAENGVIVGESTPDKVVGPNTFLVWMGGTPGDFELKVEIKMNSTNSGIQYRSKMLPPNDGQPEGNPGHAWRLGGYQMDLDFNNQYPGQLYEEAGRGFLAERGDHLHFTRRDQGADRQPRERRRVEGAVQARRMESVPPDRSRQHADSHRQRPRHGCVRGRRREGAVDGGSHRIPAACGAPMKLEIRNVAIKLL